MPKIMFVESDGTEKRVEAEAGVTLMQVARMHDVAGIAAECGGGGACGTCHVYVDAAWMDRLEKPNDLEAEMIEYLIDPEPTSRLACQVTITEQHDGMRLRVPA